MVEKRKNLIPQIDTDNASRDQLVAHIEMLKYRLEEVLPDDESIQALQAAFDLSPQQAIILHCLSDEHIWAQGRLSAAAAQWSDFAEPYGIKVQISRLRKKLPRSIRIKTLWGFGYQMESGAELVRKTLEGGK